MLLYPNRRQMTGKLIENCTKLLTHTVDKDCEQKFLIHTDNRLWVYFLSHTDEDKLHRQVSAHTADNTLHRQVIGTDC